MCGGAVGDFFASFDDMVHNTVESTIAQAKFYISHPLEAVEVAALMYFGTPPTVAISTVNYANGHGSVEQVGISVVQAYVGAEMGGMSIEGVPPEMMNVITSASASAATAAIQGKPLNEILTAGLSGSVKGLVINELSSQGLDIKSFGNKAISDAVGNASNAILNGQSIGDAIAASASRSLVSKGMQEATGQLGSMWNDIYKNSETLQGLGNTFNELKGDVSSTWEQLQSNVQGANSMRDSAVNMLDTANWYTDQTNKEVAAYEAAKFNSEHIDEWLAKTAPNEFRVATLDDGEGGIYKRFQQYGGTDENGSPYWNNADVNEVSFEGRSASQHAETQKRLAEAYATNANNASASAKSYADIYAKQAGALNEFISTSVAPLDKAYTEKVGALTSLKDQITSLDTQTKELSTSFADKYKSYQELEKEFGTEIAQQIASTAAEALKSQPGTLQIGDFVETGFGQEVTLSDGTKGKITNTGEVIAADKPSDIIPVVNKEPKGTVTLSNDTESNEIVKPGNVNDTSHLDVIPDDAERQPDGTFLDPETGIKYIPNDDGTVTTINPSDAPVVNPSPLTPNPADQKDAETYFQSLLAQGIEPALATKMSGYTPAGTGTLPSDGTGTPDGTPDGTGTLPVVTPSAPLTPPLSTVPTAPTNPDLTAGELTVEGTVPKPYEPFESDFPIQPDTTTPPVTTKPPVTTPTVPIKIPTTIPTTPPTTTTPTGALPTATDSSFSMPSTGTQATPAVTAPLSVSATSLAGAPVYNNNPQLLAELKQMYPQLSTINPKLLNMLGASSQGKAPLSQSAQVAQSQSQNDLITNLMGKGISTDLDLPGFAGGGHIHGMEYGHVPQFITGATGNYVKGRGDGQSDDIPAMLADGEYVFDADTVAQLGNGSSDAGAKLLDHFRHSLREHKRSAPVDKIPPKASPLAYMKEALKRHSEG